MRRAGKGGSLKEALSARCGGAAARVVAAAASASLENADDPMLIPENCKNLPA
jgi:hypothetical protein